MRCGNTTVSDPKQIAEYFSKQFASDFVGGDHRLDYFDTKQSVELDSFFLTPEMIFEALRRLDKTSGSGPDGVPSMFLHNCAETLYFPLYLLFSASLQKSEFPDVWKVAKIIPVHKGGQKTSFRNYRPVSIQSAIPKLFESVLYQQMYFAFTNIISEHQHGFFPGRSTETNLVSYCNTIFSSFSKGQDVHAIYTDFSKAFDKVNHSLLLHKLEAYGVGKRVVAWFASYLSRRKSFVQIGGSRSNLIDILSGVPQGSHFGPPLFLVFINDVLDNMKSYCSLFADDMKIFRPIKSNEDIALLQQDLNELITWCGRNEVCLNTSKCKFVCFSKKSDPFKPTYSLGDNTLQNVETIRDLGVILDSGLTFRDHYDLIVSKAGRSLGFIKRHCSDFSNIKPLKILYNSLVLSQLDYCCVIWNPYQSIHVERLDVIQRKFLKFMKCKLSFHQHIEFESLDRVQQYLGLLTLSDRRAFLSLSFVFKLLNGILNCPELLSNLYVQVPSRTVRSRKLLMQVFSKTEYYKYSPLNRLAMHVNNYCSILDFTGISLQKFKASARKTLLDMV